LKTNTKKRISMVNFISKKFLGIMAALVIFAVPAFADTTVGVDAVSRYVWRGTAIGDGVAVQPSVDYALNGTTIGLWGSYDLASGDSDEIDITLTQSVGPATIIVADYYLPGGAGTGEGNSFFEFGDDGGHSVEVGASVDYGDVSLFLGRFVSGETKEDTYAELSYPLSDSLSLVLGVGDGALAAEGDFALVNAGLVITGDSGYGASFTINPNTETAFFVASKSW
jgi:hypothetical protein